MTWTNVLPDSEGFYLAVCKEFSIPVLLETRIENHQYANMFGLRKWNGFLVPYISCCQKVTSYEKYEKYLKIEF